MAGRHHAARPFDFGNARSRNGAAQPICAHFPMIGCIAAGASAFCLAWILRQREDDMADSVYKVIELIGTSSESWEKAAAGAVSRAGETLRDLRVAEVVQLDLQLDAQGKVEAYRAKLKVSFKFEGS
jgi:flavin-binding protein dodecin